MPSVKILNNGAYISLREAEIHVYRGTAAFVGESRQQIRYLEEHEQRRLRTQIAADRERIMGNELIRSGRRVVFWNADDPEGRHLPGTVRS